MYIEWKVGIVVKVKNGEFTHRIIKLLFSSFRIWSKEPKKRIKNKEPGTEFTFLRQDNEHLKYKLLFHSDFMDKSFVYFSGQMAEIEDLLNCREIKIKMIKET